MGLRDSIIALSPPWLVKGYDGAPGIGGRLMYAMGLAMDVVVDKVSQATTARRPGAGDSSNLAPLGADRVIQRGIVETDANYAVRLTRAFDTWRNAGKVWGVMGAVSSWLTTFGPRMWSPLQSASAGGVTSWDVYEVGADPTLPPTHSVASPANWDWDGVVNPKRRFLIIDAAVTAWASTAMTWGGTSWGTPVTSWGLDGPPIGDTVRSMLRAWRSAGCNWLWCIVSFDAAHYVETLPAGDADLPDGTFGDWSKIVGGVRVPARFASDRYISGVDGV